MGIESKSRIAALATLLALTGCASAGEWTRRDTAAELAVSSILALDAYQTAQFHNHSTTQEEQGMARGICRAQPTSACAYSYFATVIASHWLIARLLPARLRPYWQAGVVALEIPVVIGNARLERGPRPGGESQGAMLRPFPSVRVYGGAR